MKNLIQSFLLLIIYLSASAAYSQNSIGDIIDGLYDANANRKLTVFERLYARQSERVIHCASESYPKFHKKTLSDIEASMRGQKSYDHKELTDKKFIEKLGEKLNDWDGLYGPYGSFKSFADVALDFLQELEAVKAGSKTQYFKTLNSYSGPLFESKKNTAAVLPGGCKMYKVLEYKKGLGDVKVGYADAELLKSLSQREYRKLIVGLALGHFFSYSYEFQTPLGRFDYVRGEEDKKYVGLSVIRDLVQLLFSQPIDRLTFYDYAEWKSYNKIGHAVRINGQYYWGRYKSRTLNIVTNWPVIENDLIYMHVNGVPMLNINNRRYRVTAKTIKSNHSTSATIVLNPVDGSLDVEATNKYGSFLVFSNFFHNNGSQAIPSPLSLKFDDGSFTFFRGYVDQYSQNGGPAAYGWRDSFVYKIPFGQTSVSLEAKFNTYIVDKYVMSASPSHPMAVLHTVFAGMNIKAKEKKPVNYLNSFKIQSNVDENFNIFMSVKETK